MAEQNCTINEEETSHNIFVEDHDSPEESEIESDFVGRENDLEKLRKYWEVSNIFGIFGIRSVGKSSLVKEFLKRNISADAKLIHIDVRMQPDIVSLYANICAAIGLHFDQHSTNLDRWIYDIVSFLKSSLDNLFVFFFDNTEDYQDADNPSAGPSFLRLCTSMIESCKHVKVLITSTTQIQFTRLNRDYCRHELLPLNETETKKLLKNVTLGIDLGNYENALVTLSEGLPLLILMIGSELTEDAGMITPKDMVDLLLQCRLKTLSREFYPEEDRVGKE